VDRKFCPTLRTRRGFYATSVGTGYGNGVNEGRIIISTDDVLTPADACVVPGALTCLCAVGLRPGGIIREIMTKWTSPRSDISRD